MSVNKELHKIAKSLRAPKSEAERLMNRSLAKQAKDLLTKKCSLQEQESKK
jgi:hypothetical protein